MGAGPAGAEPAAGGGRWWAPGRLHFRKGGGGGGETEKGGGALAAQCACVRPRAHFHPAPTPFAKPRGTASKTHAPSVIRGLLATFHTQYLVPSLFIHIPGNALASGPAHSEIPEKGAEGGRGKARLGEAGKRSIPQEGKKLS